MMKFKPNQTRTYDGEGFKKRAACLCFKNDREDEVLLVSSSRHPDQWIVPGGGMEPEEEPCGAAVREVYEEVVKESGLRLTRLSGCCSATSQSTRNTSADSPLAVAPPMATVRSPQPWTTTPPSTKAPHRTAQVCPAYTDRTANRGQLCTTHRNFSLDWKKTLFACIVSMFTI
uniref:Nudix (nucleoside diphosphate linked moiety X)-type motif 4a n=1 Tax=Astyanax mexicanus TaxID=7994 RepID=A0A8B9JQG0_ASTMX